MGCTSWKRSLFCVTLLCVVFLAQPTPAAYFEGLLTEDTSGGSGPLCTACGGSIFLTQITGGPVRPTSHDVSGNGSVVVGRDDGGNDFLSSGSFLWTPDTGMSFLSDRLIHSISSDGSTIVGSYGETQAFRASGSGTTINLGLLPGHTSSSAYDVSADGVVIVGLSVSQYRDDEYTPHTDAEAFRWTTDSGMVGLGDLPGGSLDSVATAVSADGAVVVGYGTNYFDEYRPEAVALYGPYWWLDTDYEAFRWTTDGGMVGLGDLPGGSFGSRANAVSADGSTVVGSSVGPAGIEAFIWTPTLGMVSLRNHLIGLGLDLTGWTLLTATTISADGYTIIGLGHRTETTESGTRIAEEGTWIANINPVPAWSPAIPQLADVPLILNFNLKGDPQKLKLTSTDLINAIADTMGKPHPPRSTRLALHTSGPLEGRAYLVDANGLPLPYFNPIDDSIFAVTTTETLSKPTETPKHYQRSDWFEVTFNIHFEGDTEMHLAGLATARTVYSHTRETGRSTVKIRLSGTGQIDGITTTFTGKVTGKQKK